jgi:hypothetical protein
MSLIAIYCLCLLPQPPPAVIDRRHCLHHLPLLPPIVIKDLWQAS